MKMKKISFWYKHGMNFIFTSLGSWKIGELKNIYFYGEILLLVYIWGQSSMDIAFFTIQDWFQKLGVALELKKNNTFAKAKLTSLLVLRHYRKLFITQLIEVAKSNSILSIPCRILKYESTKLLKSQMSYICLLIKKVVLKNVICVSQSIIQ